MNERIIVNEGEIHRPRPAMMSNGALFQLNVFAEEHGLRFMQAMCNALKDADPFYIENRELEKLIKEYIANEKDQAQ